ncbi:MAG TPA: hypothetical protein VFQ27_14525 [Xanthobacteraceae bacterium]|nr:hypothetical protein [Xanthobacteraceae bacterium]
MNTPASPRCFSRGIVSALAAVVLTAAAGGSDVRAASGPFADFPGSWSGTGTIRLSNGGTERIRCTARYRVRSSGGYDVDLSLTCASDSYKFDLTGDFRANESEQITGQWTERTRNIGGSVIGRARGNRIQIHAESSGFAADLVMTTRERRQSVSIDSRGGGQTVEASITLRRE